MAGGDGFQGGIMGLGRGPELLRHEEHCTVGPKLTGLSSCLFPATLCTFLH